MFQFHLHNKKILRFFLISFIFLSVCATGKSVNNLEDDYRIRDNYLKFYGQVEADHQGASLLSAQRMPERGSQKWRLEKVEGNTYRIRNHWTKRYLAAKDKKSKSKLALQNLNSDWTSQQWVAETANDCTYRFKNKWTGQYIHSNAKEWGNWTQRKLEKNWSSMKFRLEPIGSSPNTTICNSKTTVVKPASENTNTNANLLFKSGFEGNTHISEGSIDGLRRYPQSLKGSDPGAKSNWFRSLKDAGLIDDGFFQYTIGGNVDKSKWVTTKIVNAKNKNNKNTQALYLGVKGLNKDSPFTTRNEYNFYPSDKWTQAYAKFDFKLQDNFLKGPDTWYNFMEWKEDKGPLQAKGKVSGSNRYRNTIYLERDNSDLYWRLQTQVLEPQNKYLHTEYSYNSPIKIGEWNKVEVFWKYSENGRIWFKVNGKVVFDYWGSTVHPTYKPDLLFWAPFKNYRGREWFDGNLSNGDETWAMYDNFEIWDTIPY